MNDLRFTIFFKDGDQKTLAIDNEVFGVEVGVGKQKYGPRDFSYQFVIKTDDLRNLKTIDAFFFDLGMKNFELQNEISKLEIIVNRTSLDREVANRKYVFLENEFKNLNMYYVNNEKDNRAMIAFDILSMESNIEENDFLQ